MINPGRRAGAPADLQADATARAQQLPHGTLDAESVGARSGGPGEELVLVPVRYLVVRRSRAIVGAPLPFPSCPT